MARRNSLIALLRKIPRCSAGCRYCRFPGNLRRAAYLRSKQYTTVQPTALTLTDRQSAQSLIGGFSALELYVDTYHAQTHAQRTAPHTIRPRQLTARMLVHLCTSSAPCSFIQHPAV
eukprot:scaffold16258_cov141-Isochrysis_galbana.AAC.6